MHRLLVLTAALLPCVALAQRPAALDSTWRDYDRGAREARLRGDWSQARTFAWKLDSLLSGHPGAAVAIARASVHLGDTAAAVSQLQRVAEMGLFNPLSDSEFVALRDARAPLVAAFRDNLQPIGAMRVVATLPESDFVAEGVTYDRARGELLVASIRHGRVVRVRDGVARPFLDVVHDGGWAALAVASDASHNRLWVTTEWTPHLIGATRSDSGRSGILLYDLRRRVLIKRYLLPVGPHEPGDVCLAPNGDLYVSDGQSSAMYRIRAAEDSVRTLVRAGTLVSPQGCAVDATGNRVFVADYALGIMTVDVASGRVSVLTRPMNVAVTGVDGMTLTGDRLIGAQNGVVPNRIIMMTLSPRHDAILSVATIARDTSRIREPTHVVIVGHDAMFVANSGSGLYDDSGMLRPGATAARSRIGAVRLPLNESGSDRRPRAAQPPL